MKTKILSILALLLTVTQGAWAQVGRVLATDGKYYKNVTAATNAGTTASGMIVYWGAAGSVETGNDTYRGMAISLVDAPQVGGENITGPWANGDVAATDVTGIANVGGSYSTAVAELKGIANTAYMMGWWPYASSFAHHRAHSYAVAKPSGTSDWFEPTLGQWARMMDSFGGSFVTGTYETKSATAVSNLNTALTNAGGTALSADMYWLSTEINNSEAAYFGASGGQFGYHGKATSHRVRAMFAFSGATAAEYAVTYNANGGSGAPDAQTKDGGIDLTLSSTVPTRAGYTFAGWATSAEGAVAYSAGGSYTTDNDIVLYAQWTPTYTATFATGNDNTGWTIAPASGVQGTNVTVSYSGENKVKSVTVKAMTLSGLKTAINAASNLNDLKAMYLGKYVTAAGTLQGTSTGAIGVVAYISKSGVDADFDNSRILVLALTDANSSCTWQTSNTSACSTDEERTRWKNTESLYGYNFSYYGHNNESYPANYAAINYSASRPSGACLWFMPTRKQWELMYGAVGNNNPDTMASSANLENGGYYWAATESTGYDWAAFRFCCSASNTLGDSDKSTNYRVRAVFAY